MTIHPTETDYPTSIVGAGAPLTIDADPASNLMLTGMTYAKIAAPEVFSGRVVGEPMGTSLEAARRMVAVGADLASNLMLTGMTYAKIAAPEVFSGRVVGEPMGTSLEAARRMAAVGADLASNLMLTGMTYAKIAAPEVFSGRVVGEPMGTSLEAARRMAAVGADLASNLMLTKMTRFAITTSELFGSGVVEEITQVSDAEMVVSLLEPSPLSKLLAQLATLQHTPEDERWPDAIWPNAQAFADTQAFILRLPLNVIPLPEINLADDGEVNFLWQSDGVYVDLGFYGTGTCSYFAQGKDGCKIYGDDAPASKGLPLEVMTLFTD